jgi:superfamily I DNA/RNA helicase
VGEAKIWAGSSLIDPDRAQLETVDEGLRFSILSDRPDGRGLTVVGDDAQSIYAFRAATVRNILDFPDAFAPRADVISLERCLTSATMGQL